MLRGGRFLLCKLLVHQDCLIIFIEFTSVQHTPEQETPISTMTTKYKLTYFNAEGLGETARWIFAVAGVEFLDIRLELDEKWKFEVKPSTPFGQLPVLSVDGVEIAQSKAVSRYLARKFGLAGRSDLDEARADMIVDCAEDMRLPVVPIIYGTDTQAQRAACDKYQDEQLPSYMERFEKLLTQNNGGHGYFVGDQITWADMYFTTSFAIIQSVAKLFSFDIHLERYPRIAGLLERVVSTAAIADWIKRRPTPLSGNNSNNNEPKRQ